MSVTDDITATFEKLGKLADLAELEAIDSLLGSIDATRKGPMASREKALRKRKRELLATIWPSAYPKVTEG